MLEAHRRRREAVLATMGDAAVLVAPSAPVYPRNADVEHAYRQDSDFYWLTGFDEPESVLVMSTKDKKVHLFVRPRDPERETWDGPRAGVDGAKSIYGADEAYPIHELEQALPRLLGNHDRLFFRLGVDEKFDDRIIRTIAQGRARTRSGISWPQAIVDPASIVHEMRLCKSEDELALMKKAAAITAEGHTRVMAAARPGLYEHAMEAILLETFRRGGCERAAYGSIVGSGPNATILHYVTNNRKMEDGDLLLVDAGAEYGFYACDVTRTFPVNGRFSKEQRAIYEIVLEAQVGAIRLARPGATVDEIHAHCVEVITRGLVKLGLLQGDVESLIKDESYKAFYMHRTSHWLGMDVHDVGAYQVGGAPRRFAPGMVLTIEPGIYIAKDFTKVPPQWRGIGVRIEDDILVTDDGPVNLTQAIPKSVDDVERACAR